MSSSVEQIKDRLDIVEVISSYIKVEKAGINWKARCPFHNEKTASFFISKTRQSFYCFGCGEKGDIFSFVEKFEGLDFKGALESLAGRAGIELKSFQKEERGEAGEKERLFEIMEEAAKMFEKNLQQNKHISDYLKNRGLETSTINKWRLGFAQEEWRSLFDHLSQKGFTKEEMLGAGLIKTPTLAVGGPTVNFGQGQKYYDTFRNRVMFPISDSAGRVIAFSGRAMKEDEKTPKYLNSPETKLFHKSEVLYGFHIAKNHIRKLDYTVLVEGQMDLLMSHQSGVLNTVASSGTALTPLHLQKIKKLSNKVLVAYDSDLSGEKAAIKAAELALSLGMEAKIASMPPGEDPASTVKEDPEKWKNTLRNSEHLVDFALNKAFREHQGRNLTKEIVKSVLPIVSKIQSEIEKSQYVKKIALKMKVKEEAVWSDLKRIEADLKAERKTGEKDEEPKEEKKTSLERIMVSFIFLEESRNGEEPENGSLKKRWVEIVGEEASQILEAYEKEKEVLIFEAEQYSTGNDIGKISEDIINRMEKEYLKNRLQDALMTLDQPDISKEEEKKTQEQFEKIQRRLKELN